MAQELKQGVAFIQPFGHKLRVFPGPSFLTLAKVFLTVCNTQSCHFEEGLVADSPSTPNSQNPKISLRPSGLIPNARYTGSLAAFLRLTERKLPSR